MPLQTNWFDNKCMLVTGAHGFLGHRVVGVMAEKYGHGMKFHTPSHRCHDLRNYDDLCEYMHNLDPKPDCVVHLAGRTSGIGSITKEPLGYLMDNAYMALNVVRAAVEFEINYFVGAGSVCAYPAHIPINTMIEHNLWEGAPEVTNGPYGEAKRLMLTALRAARKQNPNFRYAYLISANLYGPGDKFDPAISHVIPALIIKIENAIRNGESSVPVWGDGTATRDFLYVEDAAEAYADVCAYLDEEECIEANIASGHSVSVRELAERLAETMGYTGTFEYQSDKPAGQQRRELSIERARRIWNFSPPTPLQSGLRQTVMWYRARQELQRMECHQ